MVTPLVTTPLMNRESSAGVQQERHMASKVCEVSCPRDQHFDRCSFMGVSHTTASNPSDDTPHQRETRHSLERDTSARYKHKIWPPYLGVEKVLGLRGNLFPEDRPSGPRIPASEDLLRKPVEHGHPDLY